MELPATLGHRRLYMLPTRHGLLFAVVLLVLLLAAVNYDNGLAFLLTFLLAGMVFVSMLDTQRNLLHLRITPGACTPVFAGEDARFDIGITNASARPRHGVCIKPGDADVACVELPAGQTACVVLHAPAQRRGPLACPPFLVCSHFPLGLVFAWTRRLTSPQRCLVYPAPVARAALIAPLRAALDSGAHTGRSGGDDFVGLRPFRHGDSPRHVSWKTLARGQGLYTKQFAGDVPDTLWFDWAALAPLDTEARLSQLCRCVLDAEQAGRRYGLRLPGTVLGPAGGAPHQHRCLAALALFDDGARADD